MQDIPTIDIADTNPRTVRQLDAACRDPGFVIVRGHGIARETVAGLRSAVIDYFARPLERKLADSITRDNYRGYIPQGFFSANAGGGAADRYEGYKLHFDVAADDPIRADCDLYGPNRWPAGGEALRRAVSEYWAACDSVAARLLDLLAAALETDPAWLRRQFEQPLTNMTLLHYPPQSPDESGFGIHPHKDTDALTILVPDRIGGLMVKARNGRDWLEVRAPDDALVVNIGDLLELWSGGRFVSTPHKVVNASGEERYSFPWFAVPNFRTVVAPLVRPEAGFDRAPVHVGDVSREVWRTNWPDAAPGGGFDLGTLPD